MNQYNLQKKKNWQWRIIIWATLFLLFGKSLGNWLYQALAIDSAYTVTTQAAKKVGLNDILGANNELTQLPEIVITVRNDTPNDYTIESKVLSGIADYAGNTLPVGSEKKITLKPDSYALTNTGRGNLIFLSTPMAGSNNMICQEIHTLNFDLKESNKIKHAQNINLSSIASRMDCKNYSQTQ